MKTLTGLVVVASLCWFVRPPVSAEPVDVSLIQLIANPKEYDGKFVRAIGFVRLEFEGNAIYLHQEDDKFGIYKNGLWIEVTDDIHKRHNEFDRKYVLLEGTFNAKMKGHMGLFSGSIQKIKRIEDWGGRAERK